MSSGPFAGTPLGALRAMIAHADASGLDAVASRWSAIHDALRQAQDDLLHHTLAATDHWTGSAADAFTSRADELHRSLGNGAAYAFNASSGVSFAADALRTAQSTMPSDPDPLEQAATCAATGTCGEPSPLMLQRQREAAAVMDQLEERYHAAGEMIGRPAEYRADTDRGVFPPQPPVQRRPGSGITSAHVHISDEGAKASASSASQRSTRGENHGVTGAAGADRRESEPGAAAKASLSSGTDGGEAAAKLAAGEGLAQPSAFRQLPRHLQFPSSGDFTADSLHPSSQFTALTAGSTAPRSDPFLTDSQVYNDGDVRIDTKGRSNAQRIRETLGAKGNHFLDPQQTRLQPEAPGGISSEETMPSRLAANAPGASDTPALGNGGGSSILPPPSNFGTRERRRRARPNYLSEEQDAWTPKSIYNPAVIE